MGRLLLLFVVLPAVELALLIELGSRFGTLHTLALIVVTGFVGASMARGQGLGVLREIQRDVEQGQLPAHSLVDGVMILVAAALLVTPGVLTDAFGFLCLVPWFRRSVRGLLWKRLERAVRENRVQMNVQFDPGAFDPNAGPREEKVVHDLRDRDS
jgi:UPF0716 protein FxsA